MADERRIAAEEVRRARPVEGEFDHAELTRAIIARFPTILPNLPNEPRWLPIEVVIEINHAVVTVTGEQHFLRDPRIARQRDGASAECVRLW